MMQTTATQRSFHLQRLPLKPMTQQVIDVEAAYKHEQQTVYQQSLMSLGADTLLTELCDEKDVTIAILEGCGSLTLCEETIPLEPGQFLFIPAQMPHTLQTQTSLVFLLNRSEAHSELSETAWSITL